MSGELAKRDESTEILISQAIEHKAPIETIERLVALKERIDAKNAEKAYNEAMAKLQAKCPVIAKKKTARGANNFSFNYAPLEHIKAVAAPYLEMCGFSYRFDTELVKIENAFFQKATCIVNHTAGHEKVSNFTAPIDAQAKMTVPQKSAAAQSYAKRYAFLNAFGFTVAEEDDENALRKECPETMTDDQKAENDPILREGLSEDEKRAAECAELFTE